MLAEKSKAAIVLSEFLCTDACKRWALKRVAAPVAATHGQRMQEPSSRVLRKCRHCCSRRSTRLMHGGRAASLGAGLREGEAHLPLHLLGLLDFDTGSPSTFAGSRFSI